MQFLQDLKYTAKMLRGIVSGYDGLQRRVNDGWEYIEYTQKVTKDFSGYVYARTPEWDVSWESFYVCALWKNGSHTPLPVLLHMDSEYPIQNAAIRILWGLWPTVSVKSFLKAGKECAQYDLQWNIASSAVE